MNIENVASRNKRSTADQNASAKYGKNLLLAIVFALMSMQMTGCCNIPRPDLFDGTLIDKAFGCYRDNIWAKRACNLRYSNCNRPYANHFEAGFEAGYIDICNGGDGYVPATPPECYWGFDYQTPDGAQCVNSWFEGFPAGVAAAKRDNAGTYRDVYVSRMIQSAIKQEAAPKTTPQDVPVVKPENAASFTPESLQSPETPNPFAAVQDQSNPFAAAQSQSNPFTAIQAQSNGPVVPPIVSAGYDYGAKRN